MSLPDDAKEIRREGYWNDFHAAATTSARPFPAQFAAQYRRNVNPDALQASVANRSLDVPCAVNVGRLRHVPPARHLRRAQLADQLLEIDS